MAWSYSNDPTNTMLDAVRFEVQDTDKGAQLLSDEEVEYAIAREAPNAPSNSPLEASESEVLSAAARCLEALARRFAAQADTQLGSLSTTYSRQAATYSRRAVELRARAAGMNAPWSGGRSESEKRSREAELDKVQPQFKRGQFHNPNDRRGGGLLTDPIRESEGIG